MSFSVIATVTDQAKQRIAQMLRDGKSFQVSHFRVSDGGHVPAQPTESIAPDPAATDCPTAGFTFGPVSISSTSLISPFCPQFVAQLLSGDANHGLSSICLIATIVYSPVTDDPDVGNTFLFAVANHPLKSKTAADTFTYLVQIQL